MPAVPLQVRLAQLDDAASLARIYNQGIEERIATFETEPRTAAQIRSRLEANWDRYPTVVVELAGQVIAWAALSDYRPRECYAGVAEHSVYTDRSARRTGGG